MFWPCETRTSTCRNFATISSGLYRFLAITVLLDVKDIPQVGPLQWGWITEPPPQPHPDASGQRPTRWPPRALAGRRLQREAAGQHAPHLPPHRKGPAV